MDSYEVMKPGEHTPRFIWRWRVTVYAKLAPNPPPLTSSFTRSVAMTAGYWQVWQNFDCSVSLWAGACHLSGVSKALLGWWHLQTWMEEGGNVLKHLDNAWTVGPVWTSYILVSAIYTKDGTEISKASRKLTQPINFSKPTVSNQQIIQVQEITCQLLFEVKINRNDFFPVQQIPSQSSL